MTDFPVVPRKRNPWLREPAPTYTYTLGYRDFNEYLKQAYLQQYCQYYSINTGSYVVIKNLRDVSLLS